MQFRQATLDDTAVIGTLMRSNIQRWQRVDAGGRVEDLPYEALSIYERWLHGGAWMSVETAALWLSHLLRGAGTPLLICDDDQLVGYAELFVNDEAAPAGHHLHLGRLVLKDDTLHDAVLQHLLERAVPHGQLSVVVSKYDETSLQRYQRYAFREVQTVQDMIVSAQGASVGFYKVSEYPNADSAQIKGWHMPIGRSGSPRQQWETLWADLWAAVPEIVEQTIHRLRFSAAGLDALVCVQKTLYAARTADVYCWTSKPISGQLVAAIRDWTYKQGYRTLRLTIDPKLQKLLGNDVEQTPQQHILFVREARP